MFIEIIIYIMRKLVFIFMPLLVLISCGKGTKESEAIEIVEELDDSDNSQTQIYPQTEFTVFATGGNVVYSYRIEKYSYVYDIWMKAEPLEGKYFEFAGARLSKHLGYYQIYCKLDKYDQLEIHTYDANGNTAYSNSIPEYGIRILPESVIEYLRNELCSLPN